MIAETRWAALRAFQLDDTCDEASEAIATPLAGVRIRNQSQTWGCILPVPMFMRRFLSKPLPPTKGLSAVLRTPTNADSATTRVSAAKIISDPDPSMAGSPPTLREAPSAPPIISSPGAAFPIAQAGRDVSSFIWQATTTELEHLLTNWMGTSLVRASRIWDLTIPGTHNSATFEIGHRESNRAFLRFASLFIRCQDKSVYEQLVDGVRFLDLRVGKNWRGNNEPVCAHGGYDTVPLVKVYRQIAEFLDQHPTEIVLLSVRRDMGYRKGPGALSLVESDFWTSLYLGRFMGPKLRSGTTISELINRRQQVIYFYSEIERYLPPAVSTSQEGVMGYDHLQHRKATTQLSTDLLPMDSVLNAPPLPRKVRPPSFRDDEEAESRSHHLGFLSSIRHNIAEELRRQPPPPAAEVTTVTRTRGLSPPPPPNPGTQSGQRSTPPPRANRDRSGRHILNAIEEQLPFLESLTATPPTSIEKGNGDVIDLIWRGGAVVYAKPKRVAAKHHRRKRHAAVDQSGQDPIFEEAHEGDLKGDQTAYINQRFGPLPESKTVRLSRVDAQRFKAVGLGKEFFQHPLIGLIEENFAFVSPYMTGRTLIEKSWAQTCESNPRFLIQKLKYWTVMHGKKPPRPAYRFRVLASEVTPPSLAFAQAGTELIKFWGGQSAATLLFLPSGLKVSAEVCNRLMLSELLTRELVARLNVITHDFCSTRIVLQILFLHLKYLTERSGLQSLDDAFTPERRVQTEVRRERGTKEEDEVRPASAPLRRRMTATDLAADASHNLQQVRADSIRQIHRRQTLCDAQLEQEEEVEYSPPEAGSDRFSDSWAEIE